MGFLESQHFYAALSSESYQRPVENKLDFCISTKLSLFHWFCYLWWWWWWWSCSCLFIANLMILFSSSLLFFVTNLMILSFSSSLISAFLTSVLLFQLVCLGNMAFHFMITVVTAFPWLCRLPFALCPLNMHASFSLLIFSHYLWNFNCQHILQ